MPRFLLWDPALKRMEDIYAYSKQTWGQSQAEAYTNQFFECFENIAQGRISGRLVPPEFGVKLKFVRCQKHFIYWKVLETGDVGIVSILHERMHQIERFKEDFNALP